MAAGLVVGAGFMGMVGFKFYQNYTSGADNKMPESHTQRMDGVVNRLVANPRLLEQYNEKYIAQKMETNSALRRTNSKNTIQRTRSQELQRRSSTTAEKADHASVVKGIEKYDQAAGA